MGRTALPGNRARRSTPSEYKRFLALRGMDCWYKVDTLIRRGMPASAIAEMIHERWFELMDWGRQKLETTIRAYRKTISDEELFHAVMPAAHTEAIKNQLENFDALEEIRWLWGEQKRRLEIDFRIETRGKKLLSNMPREMKVGVEILKTYAELSMDLGVTKRHLGEMVVTEGPDLDEIGQEYGDNVARALKDPKRASMIKAGVERIMNVLDKRAEAAAVIDVTPEVPTIAPEKEQ